MILIAAGDERMSGKLCDSLIESGYDILSVSEGKLIPEFVRDKTPDLVLIAGSPNDIGIVSLCEAISSTVGLAKIPIVILSTKMTAVEKLSAFRVGARRIVSDSDPEKVVKEVRRALDQLEISKKTHKYHEACGDDSKDFGAFPGNIEKETEQCELKNIESERNSENQDDNE